VGQASEKGPVTFIYKKIQPLKPSQNLSIQFRSSNPGKTRASLICASKYKESLESYKRFLNRTSADIEILKRHS
jgi:hypothetical protein